MRFSLMLTGFIFLFSPDIALFDLLPDVLGWWFIFLALCPLSELEARHFDAKESAKKLILISFCRFALSFFSLKFSTADLLLATFSYAIVELIFVFPFIQSFYCGFENLSVREGVKINSEKLSQLKIYLYVFFIARNVLTVLPTTVSLFDSSMTGDYSANTWFVNYEAVWRMGTLFSFLVQIALFIILLTFFTGFFKAVIKDRALNDTLYLSYKQRVLDNPVKMLKKNCNFLISCLSFSLIFFIDFYLDWLDVLPTCIGFLIMLITAISLKKRMGFKTGYFTALSAGGFAVALLSFLYRLIPLMQNAFVMDYAFDKKLLTLPLSVLLFTFTALSVTEAIRQAFLLGRLYTKDGVSDSLALYATGSVVEAFFSFVLYAFPTLNTTFTFPSLIFFPVFTALTINCVSKIRKRINADNK